MHFVATPSELQPLKNKFSIHISESVSYNRIRKYWVFNLTSSKCCIFNKSKSYCAHLQNNKELLKKCVKHTSHEHGNIRN